MEKQIFIMISLTSVHSEVPYTLQRGRLGTMTALTCPISSEMSKIMWSITYDNESIVLADGTNINHKLNPELFNRLNVSQGNLYISNLSVSDIGVYRCASKSTSGPRQHFINLTVYCNPASETTCSDKSVTVYGDENFPSVPEKSTVIHLNKTIETIHHTTSKEGFQRGVLSSTIGISAVLLLFVCVFMVKQYKNNCRSENIRRPHTVRAANETTALGTDNTSETNESVHTYYEIDENAIFDVNWSLNVGIVHDFQSASSSDDSRSIIIDSPTEYLNPYHSLQQRTHADLHTYDSVVTDNVNKDLQLSTITSQKRAEIDKDSQQQSHALTLCDYENTRVFGNVHSVINNSPDPINANTNLAMRQQLAWDDISLD